METNTNTNTMKPEDLAKLLNLSKRTVYRLIEKRQIPFLKVYGRIRFKPEDVENFMESARVEAIK